MKVEVESVLVASRLIILSYSNPITSINILHDKRNLLCDIEDSMTDFRGEAIDIFKMLIWNNDCMTCILPTKKELIKAVTKSSL